MKRWAGAILRTMLARRGCIETPLGEGWGDALTTIRATRQRVPLLMCDAAALQLQICARAIRHLDGIIAEAGVFHGGSARLLCEAKGAMPLHLFDVFETLQNAGAPATAEEVATRAHFGKVHGRLDAVRALLAPYPAVHFHPGLVGARMTALADERFALVHLDLDLPEVTHQALAFFHLRLLPGGILIGDDHADAQVRAVFRDYFAARGDTCVELPWGQIMVVRIA